MILVAVTNGLKTYEKRQRMANNGGNDTTRDEKRQQNLQKMTIKHRKKTKRRRGGYIVWSRYIDRRTDSIRHRQW